jgi:RHS repeat-associated protein
VYDLAGKAITIVGLNGVWNFGEIYAGGRHLATYANSTTYFYHSDWLGTKRAMTGMNSLAALTCTGFPFGDGVSCTGTNPSNNYFTDDVHDWEINLEHTLFRKYSGTQGRWLTPDPLGTGSADPTNPQSWNRYAYVMNDPVDQTDPLGLDDSGGIGGYGFCGLGPCGFFPGGAPGFGPCMGPGAGQGIDCGGSPYNNCFSVDCGGFPNFGLLGIGGPIGVAPLSGFAPGEFQLPLHSLSQTIQNLLAGLPWNKFAS